MSPFLIRASAIVLFIFLTCVLAAGQERNAYTVGGTLVVAVPVQEGLVTCSDKRLYNDATGTYRDDFVKIHQVGSNALFVATHTTGFLNKTTGKMEFDVFDITFHYVSEHKFSSDRQFWDGLKKEIRERLLQYLSKQKYQDWPATDVANNRLLFNLVFYSIEGNVIRSYSMSIFYEKAPTPVIFITDPAREEVKTPKLLGKGKDVMGYLSKSPSLSSDPSILRFDQSYFNAKATTTTDAVNFAKKLFVITNSALPQDEVSATYDCALLSYQNGFQWIREPFPKLSQ
jgi:hypothetical protein